MGFIDYEVDGQVGIITINRPKALNALNSEVLKDLDATIDAVDLDAIRCLIITGAGEKSFVAGADIGEMSTLTKAKQLIYTARNIKAAEAYRIGLVNEVYPLEELMPQAKKMAKGIAKNAPIAVRACKKAINEGLEVGMDEAIVIEEKLFGSCFETEDQKYGMAFFLDKNKEKVKEPFKNC